MHFKEPVPAKIQLCWRGPVLWYQDGNQWLMPSQNIGLSTEKLATQGEAIHYTITLEPHNRLWLLMLDIPTQIPNDAQLMHDYSAMATSPG